VQLEAGEDALSKGLTLEAGNHLEQAGTLARESLHEARRSVQALRPQSLEEKELPGALADLFRKMTTGTNISADFVQRGESRKLPRDWEENLLRIGQEVLTNALRHSQATEFKAALVFEPEAIRFDMHDNGRGFDPGNRHDGFGLLGISERVEGMGGQFKIESRPGEGTGILISLPFSAEHQGQK
jgi:signal transduction histidine kinase